MAPLPRQASEQDARDATVRAAEIAEQGLRLSRRQVLLGAAGLATTAVAGWLGVAATRNLWPFDDNVGMRSRSVSDLAADLKSGDSTVRQAAVSALAARLRLGDPDREGAIGALTNFLQGDHTQLRPPGNTTKAPPELSDAFMALGQANVSMNQIDLRESDLAGLDVRHVAFTEGIPLYDANLSAAVITDGVIGGSNAQHLKLDSAWLGQSKINSWFLGHASMRNLRAPGTTFLECIFAGADVTGADFSRSTFVNCDFDGKRLIASAQHDPITWDANNPPTWPPGFTPDI